MSWQSSILRLYSGVQRTFEMVRTGNECMIITTVYQMASHNVADLSNSSKGIIWHCMALHGIAGHHRVLRGVAEALLELTFGPRE